MNFDEIYLYTYLLQQDESTLAKISAVKLRNRKGKDQV